MLIMNVDADYATSYACEQMVNAARPFYRVLGAESRIFTYHRTGAFMTTPNACVKNTCAFLDRWLKGVVGDGFPVEEPPIDNERSSTRRTLRFLFFDGKGIPQEGAETVGSIWDCEGGRLTRRAAGISRKRCPGKLRALLDMPGRQAHEAVLTDRGFLLTTDPGVQVAVMRMGNGPRAVVWLLGESGFRDGIPARRESRPWRGMPRVFVVEPRGAGMPGGNAHLAPGAHRYGTPTRRDVGIRLTVCCGLSGWPAEV